MSRVRFAPARQGPRAHLPDLEQVGVLAAVRLVLVVLELDEVVDHDRHGEAQREDVRADEQRAPRFGIAGGDFHRRLRCPSSA